MFNLNCNHSIVKYIKFLKTTYKDLKNINNYYMGSNYLNFEQYFHMDWIIPIEELNKKNINIIYSKIISKNKNFKNTNFTRNNKKRNNYNI